MARDYVTIREETQRRDGLGRDLVGRAAEVGAGAGHQSDAGYRIEGVAWGAPIEKVEVKIDDGPWQPATIDHTEEADTPGRSGPSTGRPPRRASTRSPPARSAAIGWPGC